MRFFNLGLWRRVSKIKTRSSRNVSENVLQYIERAVTTKYVEFIEEMVECIVRNDEGQGFESLI
jgi:hypothetical protein